MRQRFIGHPIVTNPRVTKLCAVTMPNNKLLAKLSTVTILYSTLVCPFHSQLRIVTVTK